MASTSPEWVGFEGLEGDVEPRPVEIRGSSPEPDLEIHTLDQLVSDVRRRRGPVGTAASVLVHTALVATVVAVPLLMDAPLPEHAAGGVRAFFAAPLELTPPPPPPPPPAPAARPTAEVQTPPIERTDGIVAPIETPAQILPEAGIGFGLEGGVAGGVQGGVPGGVVGGVIGGLPEAPPAPPIKPVRVGGQIHEPKKLKAVPPVYPEAAVVSRIDGVVILECLISPQGRVTEVKVLRGVPLLEEAAVDAVRQWVYTPTLMDGVPVPIIMTVTVRFDLKNTR
jgi:periplasmic protein TonB